MKQLKNIFFLAIIALIIYLAFFIPKRITIDGNWTVSKILLDGKSLTDSKKDTLTYHSLELFKPKYNVQIHGDSLIIKKGKHKIGAKYKIQQGQNGNHLIYFASNEKALNGEFQLNIDTVVTSDTFYKVYLDIVANSTQIAVEKDVHVEPWKPRPIQKGRP